MISISICKKPCNKKIKSAMISGYSRGDFTEKKFQEQDEVRFGYSKDKRSIEQMLDDFQKEAHILYTSSHIKRVEGSRWPSTYVSVFITYYDK